ncbi:MULTISPECIES: DNA polymerase III subunit delta [unclassified Streptococcus]|uniref:DNA polymerase III subunit delta n=1 Tax=unclassified Streptococcus TaxID=2608887 RepID=UPI00107267A0|nr:MULTISPECIES: DNA polymerase III subunit delta [unclassified Streptococcus]MBF0786754.1 DNA polymerase III subunit delta [Streptococcus sp. 19428wC2_LYSM12]MCQ9210991.1 DNA polymerase III subunit delta [Streptococcus sp. B01]MCQ9214264.1 DNA polymerase III subunit delta [Streptococcus sp. O1]TFV06298.1 DNA polymerase III subunit delta [Streptococcus sp. LYSM12]
MTIIDEIRKMKKENLALLTVLTGEDIGQFQLAKEILLKRIGFDSSDLTYAYFDMSETDYAQVELDLVSLPFFSDEKIVILDYFADVTTDKKRYLSDEELKKFEDYLSQPVETTKLIVIAGGKLDSKRRLVKLLKRDGFVLEANSLKEAELRQFFKQEIGKMGLSMDNTVMDHLLNKSNFDFAEIHKNLAFLYSYKGDSQISLDDIEQAIPKTLQDNLFDMSQLLLQGKIDQAQSLVRDLRLQGEDEIKLIAILLNQFRLFLQVQMLHKEGLSEQHMVTELSTIMGRKMNPFQVKFALRDSRSLSLSFLKKAVQVLIETDYQIKQGQFDKDYLFDIALLKIASA